MTRPTTTGKAQDLITFTRSTTGTYLGSDGLLKSAAINEARIEYDASGNCLGLLVEEARTNLFRYSQEFSNVSHALITTDNATVSPDGTQNASLCIPTSANENHYFDDQNVIAGTDYAMSCFAKYGSGSYLLAFRGSGIGNTPPQFNLQTGTVVNEGASSVWSDTKIEDVGNGWYKCSSVGNPINSTPLRFQLLRSDGAVTFIGDGTGHYIWGAQVEVGSFSTSYIPTSGSTVTRAADVASLAVSEFGYNQDQGTVVIERRFLSNDVNSNSGTDLLEDGSNKISLRKNLFLINVNASGQVSSSYGGSIDYVSFHKIGLAFKPNSVIGSTSGGLSAEDTSALIPDAVNTIQLNRVDTNASFHINGHIKSIQYYPLRLSNAQLQALTV
jgi:hypothetical protein